MYLDILLNMSEGDNEEEEPEEKNYYRVYVNPLQLDLAV